MHPYFCKKSFYVYLSYYAFMFLVKSSAILTVVCPLTWVLWSPSLDPDRSECSGTSDVGFLHV